MEARGTDIDTWVLKAVDECYRTYSIYRDELLEKPNVLISRYEEMVSDFTSWRVQVLDFCGLTLSDVNRRALGTPESPGLENKYAHRRQVAPGDHRRKLKQPTVARLTERLREILDVFNYAY
jgi:hypothetical protein